MKKLILTKGLPGSGKTTWAKAFLEGFSGKWKRINKDDLRMMLDNGKYSKLNEKFVLTSRDTLILEALKEGYNVIVDDTNLAPVHEPHIRQLVKGIAEVDVMDFTDVPLDECLKRDQKRANYVGEKAIRNMYNKFLKSKTKLVEPDNSLFPAIICDLDGTLAASDGNPYDRDFTKDSLKNNVAAVLKRYCSDTFIVLVSGRKDTYKQQTVEWLHKYGIPFNELHMRKGDDVRKDAVVKKEIYEAEIKGKYNVLFVLDDRNQVVDMWRDEGLTCLQVDYGDF